MKLTIKGVFDDAVQRNANRVFCIERNQYRRTVWTYTDLRETSDRIATYLNQLKLKKGDMVGLWAPNGPIWVATYFACARTGIIVVPIDVNASDEFVNKLVQKTKLSLLIKTIYRPIATDCRTIEIEQLSDLASIDPDNEFINKRIVEPDDTLEIVFTSGSTGDPKGVMLTNRNVTSNLHSIQKVWQVGSNHTLLSMIPLSHMFEQTVGFLIPFCAGSKIVYVQSVRPYQIVQALRAENITTVVTVPAFLKMLKNRITDNLDKTHSLGYITAVLKVADHLPYPIRRYMFQAIHSQLGNNLKLIIVGGSPLQPNLEAFWEQLGIHILQGYGLTETSPIVSYSSLSTKKRGSVGKSLPGQTLKLGQNNEILLAGDNVFVQYFNDPEATQKVFVDGFFRTGDIGRLDEQDYLFITGRQKNMLLSDSGLNIYPEDIESLLSDYHGITDSIVCMLHNDGANTLTAVILSKNSKQEIADIIEKVNSRLASHQVIQNYILWPNEDFPRTPTRKIKRNVVVEQANETFAAKQDGQTHKPQEEISKTLSIVSSVAGVSPEEISKKSNLVSDLKLDSLKRLELVSKMEEELGAYVNEADINSTTTFEELELLVKSARHNPKSNIVNYSLFESRWFAWVRVILQLPLIWAVSIFQRISLSRELADSDEPAVYVANHTSHIDTITMLRILSMSRRSKLLIAAAEDYFFNNRLKSILLRIVLPIIPIDRKGNIQETLLRLGRDLDKGYSILIFPEGTRGPDSNQLGRFLPGIGVIAQELNVPIIPLKFRGNEKILKKGKKLPSFGKTTVASGAIYEATNNRLYDSTSNDLEQIVRDL